MLHVCRTRIVGHALSLRKAGSQEGERASHARTRGDEEITDRIIGAAIEVHRKLGPGFVESIYEAALCVELRKRSIPHARQMLVPVIYDGVEVGQHRLDLFVENEIVVELKAVREVEAVHFAFARSYLRAVGRRNGLLLDFNAPTLEIKRVIAPHCVPNFLPSLDILAET